MEELALDADDTGNSSCSIRPASGSLVGNPAFDRGAAREPSGAILAREDADAFPAIRDRIAEPGAPG